MMASRGAEMIEMTWGKQLARGTASASGNPVHIPSDVAKILVRAFLAEEVWPEADLLRGELVNLGFHVNLRKQGLSRTERDKPPVIRLEARHSEQVNRLGKIEFCDQSHLDFRIKIHTKEGHTNWISTGLARDPVTLSKKALRDFSTNLRE